MKKTTIQINGKTADYTAPTNISHKQPEKNIIIPECEVENLIFFLKGFKREKNVKSFVSIKVLEKDFSQDSNDIVLVNDLTFNDKNPQFCKFSLLKNTK